MQSQNLNRSLCGAWQANSSFFYYYFFKILNYLTLQYCIGFAIYQNESARYTCVPHPEPSSLLPPHTIPLVVPVHQPQASSIEPGLATHFIHDIIHVSMLFSRISPPSPSPTESIRLFYTSVSLLLSQTQGYCYHLSKFHIYALVYCIGVFPSGLLHSV